MPVKSNIDQFKHLLTDLAVEIKDDASKTAMIKVSKASEKALDRASRLQGIFPSYVTGQDKLRSRKQKRQNERYGRSITNWKSVTYENPDDTGAITGSPSKLGYRLWFIERGTKSHSRWGRSTGAGFRPRPFVASAKKEMAKKANDIITRSVNKTIRKYTR